MKVAVIGGGAAGFFAAISCKTQHPDAAVSIFEKTAKTLTKVKVSGGGRCNVTNACEPQSEFLRHYPRGQKQLKKTFNHFNRKDTIEWFEKKGVLIKAESDGRMFPKTDDSQTIIDCLRNEVKNRGASVVTKVAIMALISEPEGFSLTFDSGQTQFFNHVIVATGGSSKSASYDWLRKLGHAIVEPVPSLFTFNIQDEPRLKALMGLAVPYALVKIQGTKLAQGGPVLITHWGLSGPAALKLSAWGARQLHEMKYDFNVQINWAGTMNEEMLRTEVTKTSEQQSKKKIINAKPFELPNRLWEYLLSRVDLKNDTIWTEVKKKDKNRLINVLLNDEYKVLGKTTFKEEFVTCGGVELSEVDFNTMESRKVPGMYFAGEVLDIDGVTGGFNFQAAWSTGFVAGKLGK
ncbi:MAG: NAD(P)/FAD-dependent oxidoreductase [Reichenbachiella sp.]|uniref:NAD(P)/FAD-dependent oxidoreductase n=1 Tax=Reichenbachiella sp. TaxID=2184521 RepID=UPI0032668895